MSSPDFNPYNYECPVKLDYAVTAVNVKPCNHMFDQSTAETLFGVILNTETPNEAICSRQNQPCPLCRRVVTSYVPNEEIRKIACRILEGKDIEKESPIVEAFTALSKEAFAVFRTWAKPSADGSGLADYYIRCCEWLKPHQRLIEDYNKHRTEEKNSARLYKERLKSELGIKVDQLLNQSAPYDEIIATLKSKDSTALQYLNHLYRSGNGYALSWYFYNAYNLYEKSERKALFEPFVKNVVQDFEKGLPHSFETMGDLLHSHKIGRESIKELYPFNDIATSLAFLAGLAALGIYDAKRNLHFVFYYGTIRDNSNNSDKEELSISSLERDRGLLAIAKTDYWIFLDDFSNLTSEEKLALILEKFKKGEKNIPYCQVKALTSGKVADLPFPMSKEERLQRLLAAAETPPNPLKDDPLKDAALQALYRGYTGGTHSSSDYNDETLIETPMTIEERFAKIDELKRFDREFYGLYAGIAIRDNRIGSEDKALSLNLSQEEQIKRLEILANESQAGLATLAEVYVNRIESMGSEVPENFPEIFKKIFALAEKGSSGALYFIFEQISSNNHSLMTGRGPMPIATVLSRVQMFNFLIKHAKNGAHGAKKLALDFIASSPQKDVLGILFDMIEFAK